ncbi:MAG TPA: Rne/Rng family ribonuclease [Candidatus Polarisedimenticolaceae bacterium]|nr:Rne/Rng family ribonuclease [Candidatus Polarisedimenticolaceae bacterium]
MANELLFSRLGGRTAAALREGGVTAELRIEDDATALAAGRVIKGRVSKVLPGIQSAFLDVGQDRDAFLHVADLLLPGESAEEFESDDDELEGQGGSFRRARRSAPPGRPIESRLKVGREVLVQIVREGFSGKGPRVTCFITLPGRYLVYAPLAPFRAVSRRIADPAERERLRAIVSSLPGEGGFIVRTAGAGASPRAFAADAEKLAVAWRGLTHRAAAAVAPAVVHSDLDLFLRTLRDASAATLDRIVVDDDAMLAAGTEFLRELDPELLARLSRHTGRESLFDETGVTDEVERALRPRVWLKSGGTLVIQQTEALVSIDVNTGKYLGARHPEETVLKTNLEAAAEIARQLRLRDLAGIIVVDFIDMDRPEHRASVLEALEGALRRDRARTKIVGLSDLGLLQLTRKRTRAGLEATLTRPCPSCSGSGRVKTAETLALEALVEVRRIAGAFSSGPLTVTSHPDVARALRLAIQVAGPVLDRSIAERLVVREDPAAPSDRFDVSAL